MLERSEIEILEDVQHLEKHHAASRRLVGRDVVPPILPPQRLVACSLPGLEILDRQQCLVLFHVFIDRLGDLAEVEDVGTAFRDGSQGLTVVAIDDLLADLLRDPIRPAIERPCGRREAGALMIRRTPEGTFVGPPEMHVWPHRPAILGPVDRRLYDTRPRQAAVLLVRLVVHLEVRGRTDRLVADVVDPPFQDESVAVTRFALDQVGPHVRPRCQRRRRVRIDVAVKLFARHVDAAGAEARNAAHLRVDDSLHQRAGDAGIDGVPAFTQDLGPSLRRFGLWRHDHRGFLVSHSNVPPFRALNPSCCACAIWR